MVWLVSALAVSNRCRHESHEHGLGAEWSAREFWVELPSYEVRVDISRQFKHLHDFMLRMPTAEYESCIGELLNEFWLDFITVSESFSDMGCGKELSG